ncbi:hypothetical protein PaeBR_09530 [Paenibacillus sp. BR2-3]|uniref:hypothetical protein n=1 Tax=Paenibacillus sp. BR2-3 TaxID=3048494 RepID=UPI0039775B1D
MARIKQIKNSKSVVWTEALTQFLFWKKAHGVSEQTRKDYDQHVRLFFKRYSNSFDTLGILKNNLYECVEQEMLDSNPIKTLKKLKMRDELST